ncbi:hypothetical protein ACFQ1L_36015 [Phytohabitans flavus]|uniref:hypothetical protein n=1 Tax=Phytohabitans flavus TaxID=1076124 RepID=UPI00362BB7BB
MTAPPLPARRLGRVRRARRRLPALAAPVAGMLGMVGLISGWWAAVAVFGIADYLIPAPPAVAAACRRGRATWPATPGPPSPRPSQGSRSRRPAGCCSVRCWPAPGWWPPR